MRDYTSSTLTLLNKSERKTVCSKIATIMSRRKKPLLKRFKSSNLSISYAKKQNFAEAIRQFKNAKDQKPEDISIRLNLLSTLVTIKNTNDTETEIKELLKLRPNDSDIAIKAATAYQKIENTVAAISTLQEFTERNPGDAKVNATLARLLYLNGNLAESKYYITRSLELAPEDQKNLEFLTKLDKEACVEADT